MSDGIAGVRATLESARPTAGTFAERRARWTPVFHTYCPVPAGTTVEPWTGAGAGGDWVTAPGVAATRDRVLLYFHGGGFTAGSAEAYRGLAARLSAACGRPVLAADYRLAPEHPFPAALEDCSAAYRWLLGAGVSPKAIAIAGDSAGGNFTLATLIKARDDGLPLPGCGVGMSAQADMTLSGESVTARAPRDAVITPQSIRMCAAAYLGGADGKNPLASPLFADPTGLPPLLLQVGTEEMLYSDNVRFVAKAKAAAVDVTLEEWPEMIHVWHLFTDRLAEARDAIAHIAAFVTKHAND